MRVHTLHIMSTRGCGGHYSSVATRTFGVIRARHNEFIATTQRAKAVWDVGENVAN